MGVLRPDRLALSRAVEEGKALSTLTVLSLFLSYSGKCAAAVVSSTERYAERLAFDVRWLEEMPFNAVPRRIKRAMDALEKSHVRESVFLAETTAVGRPGAETLSAQVGQMPVCVLVTGERTRPEEDPLVLSLTDMMGAVQTAVLGERLTVPEGLPLADALLSAIRGIEFSEGHFQNADSPVLRAVALGLWYSGLSLGDNSTTDPETVKDEQTTTLEAEKEQREFARNLLGEIDHLDGVDGF